MPRETIRETTLRCAGCEEWKHDYEFTRESDKRYNQRRGRAYQCVRCLGIPAFDHPRPPSMQGRQQSIFTGRKPCPPPPIKPERHDYSREFFGPGQM
jgi:hypothetical protein